MPQKNNQNTAKSRRKWPWITLASLILIIGIVRLVLMTGPVHRLAKHIITRKLNEQFKPTVSIGHVSGDLWHEATLTDIKLTRDRTVAAIDTLHIEYHLLSYFGDQFEIPELHIVHPFTKVRQRADSSLNVQHWMITDTTDTSSSTFAVSISDLRIKRGQVDVEMPYLQPDSAFQINHINMRAGIDYTGEKYSANLSKFDFKLIGTRLSPVSVRSRTAADEQSLSIKKLAIATAHSVFHASGQANLTDTTGRFRAKATPLGWRDVAAYADSLPAKKNMQLALQVNADRQQVDINLTANAAGIDQLKLSGTVQRDSVLALSSAQITARALNLAKFMNDTTMANLKDLRMQAHGNVPISDYQKGHLKGTVSARDIKQGSYGVDVLTGTFALEPQSARVHLEPQKNGQKIIAEIHVARPWAAEPSVALHFRGSHINPAVWYPAGGESMKGDLSFSGKVSGTGWYPQQSFWHYDLRIDRSSIMDQPLSHATITGRLNRETVSNQTHARLKNGRLKLRAEVHHLQQVPVFSYSLKTKRLDLGQLAGMQEYPSSINAVIEGKGRGQSLQDVNLQTSLRIDSSVVKGEKLKDLSMHAAVADSVITLTDGSLKSSIADGTFTAHLNLFDYRAPTNRAHFELQLKDLSSLASLVGAQTLQATGQLKGDLKSAGSDTPVMNSSLDLKNVNYNQQFTSPKISGNAGLKMAKNTHFSADLDISEPTIYSTSLQDLSLRTEGIQKDKLTNGSYHLLLKGAKHGKIVQSGRYWLSSDSTKARINQLDLVSSQGTLSLRRPFRVSLVNGRIQTDTLRLRSEDRKTAVVLAIPLADSTRQKGYLKARNLDLAALQKVFLEQPYFKGILSGQARINRSDTTLSASGAVTLSKIHYNAINVDSVKLQAQVKNKRLKGNLSVHRNGKQILEGQANLPFALQDTSHLSKAFSRQKVNAYVRVQPIALSEFSDLLKAMDIKNTRGRFQFNGRLGGQADHPRLKADLSLENGKLSGVPVDSLTASMRYLHNQSRLKLHSSLISGSKKMIQIDGSMPFKLNLSTLDLTLPDANDSVSADIVANDYKLKTLNDFVSRNQFRNITGLLNADIHIRGRRADLQPSGTAKLQNAAVRVVQEGIRLDHIQSTVQMANDNIIVQNLAAKSGKGQFTMHGKVGFAHLVPGKLDLQATAKNLKIANTDKLNGIINMNMQLNGTATQPKISGDLDVVSGFAELSNFGEKSVENVQLDTTASAEPNVSLYDSLSMNMQVSLNKRFVIRNKRYLKMEITLDGQVHLLKKPGNDLQLFGTLNTVGGYAEPLGKRFDLQKGSIAFDGDPTNPQLNIHTRYEPPQTDQKVKIYYVIEGTVENPEFKYNSDPPMDLTGIISYTLFGQPYYKLNSTEQGVASSSGTDIAADFAMQVIMNRLESLATGKLGIDVVRIDNTKVGGKSGTSITTGWYINPKVFFAIQNVIAGSAPTTGFYLEYYLEKNLKLILSQGNDNQQGVDLQWNYDY